MSNIVSIGSKQWEVYIARTYQELTSGLSGYTSLDSDKGMLFFLGNEQYITLTTEDMLFPIDVAFINSSGEIVDILHDYIPGQVYETQLPVSYMLEVNSGDLSDAEVGEYAALQIETQTVTTLNIWVAIEAIFVIAMILLQARSFFRGFSAQGVKNE